MTAVRWWVTCNHRWTREEVARGIASGRECVVAVIVEGKTAAQVKRTAVAHLKKANGGQWVATKAERDAVRWAKGLQRTLDYLDRHVSRRS